jgi:hypothetical protein
VTAPASDAAPDIVTPVTAPVIAIDAAVTATPKAPVAPNKAPAKPPPTKEALQKSVERIGGRLNSLKAKLEKEKFESIRRMWLDLAAAVPDLGNAVDERRKFASRVKRLNSAIKKASRVK